MPRTFKGARTKKHWIEGRQAWRIDVIHPDKLVQSRHFPKEAEADEYKTLWDGKLARAGEVTFDRAIVVYEKERLSLRDSVEVSIVETTRRLQALFGPVAKQRVSGFTIKRFREVYYGKEEGGVLLFHGLVNRPTLRRRGDASTWQPCKLPCRCPGDGPRLAVDSHRNYLAEGKTFLRWCTRKEYLGELELDDVDGIGNRNPGGLGRNKLRKKDLRALYRKCIELAPTGDEGAVGILFALLFGFRATEITTRQCRDIDEETWTVEVDPEVAKTEASDRDNEIPKVLRPFIRVLMRTKRPDQYLFGNGHEPHSGDWPTRQLERLCLLARVPVVNAHSLRGAHEDLAKAAGQTAKAVALQLGHRDEKTGERSYTSEMGRRGARRSKQSTVLGVLEGGKKAGGGAW